MKGIQNKKFISWKPSYTYPVYVIRKENYERFCSCPAYVHAPTGDFQQAQ
jgi:hypothetical protein